MPKVIFGPLSNSRRGWSLVLNSPKRTYSTNDAGEIGSLLAALEAEALAGAWVALMLSYEAAPAFDLHLETKRAQDFPLLWAAVFDQPSSVQPHQGEYKLALWQPLISQDEYSRQITNIRELIASGDTYQVNYTFPLATSFQGDSLAWYRNLCEVQRADYCVYVDFENYTVLSISPELFFERKGDRITTRPMKGTNKRGRWSEEDEQMAALLSTSPKQRAENVMIVDLLRNDLGKISNSGSVEVSDLFRVEQYPTVWQMTSTVESRLKPQTSLADVLAALFPCGSVTGAPKIRTMQIIKDLEPHPRHVYTGTIGLIRPGGDCTFNVAIRTVVLNKETGIATFGVGGGITYSSTAENEYEECLLKTSFLTTNPPRPNLVESILLENGDYFLLDKHLSRLEASARYFDLQFDREEVSTKLEQVKRDHITGEWKVRLILNHIGEVVCESVRLESNNQVLRVGLAHKPVDPSDATLYHKLTTNLARYQEDLREHLDWQDVILWNERGEVTESSIANIVVRLGGRFVTPPISSGLLPGTFRELLIEEGTITEAVVTVEQLRQAAEFYLINSVRKWRAARLVEETQSVAQL